MSKPQKKRNSKKTPQKKRKIKEIKKEKKEVNKTSLEKDIQETENIIEDNEFRAFLQPIQIPAPILRKVETPNLEINIASSPTIQTKEKETGLGYSASNEPKYSDTTTTNEKDEKKYESEFRPPILRQTDSRELRQEILTPPREAGMQESQDPSMIETNILEQRRREPFETQEKKYSKVADICCRE